MHRNREGFLLRDCGCRVHGGKVCKHFYANQRSASTEPASGTGPATVEPKAGMTGNLVHPGIPQPAPTFFHWGSVRGTEMRLLSPDVRGETWEHTAWLRREYRYRLRRLNKAGRSL